MNYCVGSYQGPFRTRIDTHHYVENCSISTVLGTDTI